MKRALAKCNAFVLAAIIAAAILLVIWGINFVLYKSCGFIIGLPMFGGEISVTHSFGMILEHYYPLTAEPVSDSTSLTFSPVLAIISYVVIYVISLIIARVIKNKAAWSMIKEGEEV